MVNSLMSSLYIQVDKGMDVVLAAVNVIRHRIMSGIQNPFDDMKFKEESSYPEPGFQESMGIVF